MFLLTRLTVHSTDVPTALLNTIATSAAASYLAFEGHAKPTGASVHGYTTALMSASASSSAPAGSG